MICKLKCSFSLQPNSLVKELKLIQCFFHLESCPTISHLLSYFTHWSRNRKKISFIEECCSYRLKFWCPDFILQSVWGSYWQEGKWGYACCHSFIRNSYCTGDAGKTTSASRVGVERTLMWQLHVMSYKGSHCIEVVILGIRRNSRKCTKLNYLTSLNSGTSLE